jgi:spore coat protein U-like protein
MTIAGTVSPVFGADELKSLNVKAQVSPVFSVNMVEPDTFNIVGANGKLIPSKQIGSPVIVSNYTSWKISVDSSYETSATQGRLKLDDATYIPYTFALKDGDAVVVSSFLTPSAAQSITTKNGKSFDLFFYFDSEDATVWPQGIYQDTVTLSISTD